MYDTSTTSVKLSVEPTVDILKLEPQVNLARVAKDFSYASGKSFQKKYAKLKKAHNLTNGHIYGDYKASRLLSVLIRLKLIFSVSLRRLRLPRRKPSRPSRRLCVRLGKHL